MPKTLLLLATPFFVACAGGDHTELEFGYPKPGTTRIDGDPWEEVIDAPEFAGFIDDAEREEYCAAKPDAPVCSTLGSARQAWTSAEFHGFGDDNRPCYSSAGTNGQCAFPQFKQMRVVNTTTHCFDDPNLTTTEYSAVLDGFRDGVLSLNGIGTNVVVSTTSASSHLLTIDCLPSSSTQLGTGGLSGSVKTQIGNLPVGPHGIDEGAALQVLGSIAQINPTRIKAHLIGCGLAGTTSQMRGLAQYAGVHEGLHALGFRHFSTGVMKRDANCSDTGLVSVPQGFRTALSIYNGSTSGGVNIVDTGLQSFGP